MLDHPACLAAVACLTQAIPAGVTSHVNRPRAPKEFTIKTADTATTASTSQAIVVGTRQGPRSLPVRGLLALKSNAVKDFVTAVSVAERLKADYPRSPKLGQRWFNARSLEDSTKELNGIAFGHQSGNVGCERFVSAVTPIR